MVYGIENGKKFKNSLLDGWRGSHDFTKTDIKILISCQKPVDKGSAAFSWTSSQFVQALWPHEDHSRITFMVKFYLNIMYLELCYCAVKQNG